MPRTLRAGLLAAAVSLLIPASSLAETYTVDPADSNNACAAGTDTTCKTIGQAIAAAKAGDTINVLKGTYAESVSIPSSKGNLTLTGGPEVKMTGSGTGDVITIAATGVTINGFSIEVPANAGSAVRVDSSGAAKLGNIVASRPNSSTVNDAVIDVAGTSELDTVLVLQQAGAVGTPAISSSGGGVQLNDVIAACTTGPVVSMTTSDKNRIVRSTLLSSEATDAGSNGVQLVSETAGARKLTVDSSIIVGGAKASGILVKTNTSSAGDAALAARHVTIAASGTGITLDASGATGNGGLAIPPTPATPNGNITATINGSIVHALPGGPSVKATAFQATLPLLQASNTVKATLANSDGPPASTAGGATVDMGGASNTPDAAIFAKGLTLRADAPLIDKGGAQAGDESATDVNGDPRTAGPATDIGADEFVNKPPKADFGMTNDHPKQGEDIGLLSTSVDPEEVNKAGGGIVEYDWDFGDGGKQTASSPGTTHHWDQLGTYTVSLTVKDKQGAVSDVVRKTVTVVDGTPPVATFAQPPERAKLVLNPFVKRKRHHKTVIKKLKPLPLTLQGQATDPAGVTKVEVALYITKRAKARKTTTKTCEFYTGKSFTKKPCDQLVFVPAILKGDTWQLVTRRGLRLPAGSYAARVRATDGTGNVNTVFTRAARSLVHFSVK